MDVCPLVELEARPGDQIPDGLDTSTSPVRRAPRRARRLDGDALHVVAGDLDFASMEATADLNAERSDRFGNGAGAAHGPCRAIESGEKAVTKRFHFVAAGTRKFSPHGRVMRIEQIVPTLVTQLLSPRRRTTMSVNKTVARTR